MLQLTLLHGEGVVMEMLSHYRGESGSGKSHLCEKLMVEILKREKVSALWTKELFKVE